MPTAPPNAPTIRLQLPPGHRGGPAPRPARGTPQGGPAAGPRPAPGPRPAAPPPLHALPAPPAPHAAAPLPPPPRAAAPPAAAPPAAAPHAGVPAAHAHAPTTARSPAPSAAHLPALRPSSLPAPGPADVGPILELVRRVALQRDLASAVGVIDLGAGELVAGGAAIAIVGSDGSISSPRADDLRAAAQVVQLDVVARIARGTTRAVTPRAIVVPCDPALPSGGGVALIAHRPAMAPGFGDRDQIVLVALAAQLAPILRGFIADHATRAAREVADQGGLFRAEALKQARAANAEGKPIFLSPTWLRWAYPAMIGLVVVMIAAAALVQVPSYSTGSAMVVIAGEKVTCPTGGTVAAIEVDPGQEVKSGDILVRLHSTEEEADLQRTDAEYRVALSTFLFDPSDQLARAALSSIAATRQRALAQVDSRVIRASRAGVVNDVRVRPGELLLPGAPVLSIVDRDAEPSVVAFLPGSDRPRLKVGMTLQVQLSGFSKSREAAVITEIGSEVIGAAAARKYLGETVGDALPMNSSNVIVHAKLPGRTFEAGGNRYEYHDGMTALGEVRVEAKSFLRTLITKD